MEQERHAAEKGLAKAQPPEYPLLGRSPRMQELMEQIRKAAASKATILLRGESGVGKELIARTIHDLSSRRAEPFLPVDCGALAETLLESEIFGHVKGAFTGALSDRAGLAETAGHGSLFFDEVSETTNAFQLKLLRLAQSREFKPVGSSVFRKSHACLMAASNADLESLVRERQFRKDLYYRLNVVTIHVPPLRDRAADIPLLADHFLSVFARRDVKARPALSRRAIDALLRHSWPGNVRELENLCERLVVMNEKRCLEAADLEEHLNASMTLSPLVTPPARRRRGRTREEVELAIEQSGGRMAAAGELLGVSRQHVYRLRKRSKT